MAYAEMERSPLADDVDFQNALRTEIDAAIAYVDGELSPERTTAQEYYRGELFGDEVEGRSKVVMTVLRDVVTKMLPGLMRVFAGSDRVAEFQANSEAKVAEAEQQTEYVNHVFLVDNPGFMVLYAAFKDALVKKLGVVKWYWDERKTRTEEKYSGLTMESVEAALAAYPDAEMADVEQGADGLISMTLRRTETKGRLKIEALPPEEFLINRTARSIDEARFVAHRRTDLTVADLVAMGYDEDEVLAHAGVDTDLDANEERTLRRRDRTNEDDDAADPRLRPVLYIESYMQVPDAEGIPVLRKICSVGPQAHILYETVVEERPFADFCPDPEPHTMDGSGYYERTKDVQRIMSHLVRGVLDSLGESIHPRTAFVESAVNADDLLNPEVGGLVRTTAPGMIQPLTTPFVGRDALPVIELFTGIVEERTGVTRAASGLDADALQSSTRAAVEATIKAADAQVELVARLFAEGGMKRLMRGIARTLRRNQQQERIVKLRGQYVQVSPATWDADLDVIVNVGLGSGSVETKMGVLAQVISKQEAWIEKLGPDNPLAGYPEYRNAISAFLELSGRRDISRFVKPQPPGGTPAQPPAPTPPDPAELLAQVEREKLQLDSQMRQAELALKQWEAQQRNDRERDKMESDLWLRTKEIEAKYAVQLNTAQLRAELDRERMNMETQQQQQQAPA